MENLMIDLETLATRPDAVVLSIGACAFDERHGVGPTFYVVVDRNEQQPPDSSCRYADPRTVAWWAEQSAEAREVLEARGERVGYAILWLKDFMALHCRGKDTLVWGNGADFDNAILGDLCDWGGIDRPWGYHGGRCYRTLKNLLPESYARFAKELPRVGLHNAQADAAWQASIAVRLLRSLSGARATAEAALALTDGDGSLTFGPVMPGPERDGLQAALNGYRRGC